MWNVGCFSRELQLQLLRRDNDNNEMKKTTEQTLQEWTEIQMMWELMAKQMNGLEQALFPLDDDSLLQRIGSSHAHAHAPPHTHHRTRTRPVAFFSFQTLIFHLLANQARRARRACCRGITARRWVRRAARRRRPCCPSAGSSGSLAPSFPPSLPELVFIN
jgi:hypothetical protein